MSIEELSALHGRYVELSHRFRGGWVFHQFLRSHRKVSGEAPPRGLEERFQRLYAELKSISAELAAPEAGALREHLGHAETRFDEIARTLRVEDSRVSPEELRRFFLRSPRHDEKILVQLARFYVDSAKADGWSHDRVDKLDFLLTRLAGEEHGKQVVLAERRSHEEAFASLWAATGAERPSERELVRHHADTDHLAEELAKVDDLDDLNGRELVPRWREIKHGLGPLILEPSILRRVLSTNLALKNLVRRLHRREERRIASDYQRVFDLQGAVPVSGELAADLSAFQAEIGELEGRIEGSDFRLQDLSDLRDRVRGLLGRLEAQSSAGGSWAAEGVDPDALGRFGDLVLPEDGEPESGEGAATEEIVAQSPPRKPRPAAGLASMVELEAEIDGRVSRLMEAVVEVDPEEPPQAAASLPELAPLRLEAREVEACRRLAGTSDGRYDRPLERFLVEGVALRLLLDRRGRELRELPEKRRDDSGESSRHDAARQVLRRAAEHLERFAAVNRERLLTDAEDARRLELLRVRLMEAYAATWLPAYRPFL